MPITVVSERSLSQEMRSALTPGSQCTVPHLNSDKQCYIGTHYCGEMGQDFAVIELWAFTDEENDIWFGWFLSDAWDDDGSDIGRPINFCPFCGVRLLSEPDAMMAEREK